jgi:hypothetical protein
VAAFLVLSGEKIDRFGLILLPSLVKEDPRCGLKGWGWFVVATSKAFHTDETDVTDKRLERAQG